VTIYFIAVTTPQPQVEPRAHVEEAILGLDRLDPALHIRFGGKALGLARLVRTGVDVPEGFALAATTEAPELWSDPLRALFLDTVESLLERGPVAVRSSALVEDQPTHSFAGLFETVLDVGDTEGALAAAAHCIASGASYRVRSYAGRNEAQPVGVVVQTMVHPRAAGVLFTRDPRGRDEGMLIEAVQGSGEALVSGHRAPESWRVYRSGLGRWETRCEAPGADDEVLSETLVVALAREASRLAESWQTPLDLEWAITPGDGVLWLQGRPITSLVEAPRWIVERSVEGVDDGPITVWSNWNVRETMPDPLPPLSWCLWRESILPFLTEHFFGVSPRSPHFEEVAGLDRIQGRIYFNLNAILATPLMSGLVGSALAKVDSQAGAAFAELAESGVLTPRRLPGSRVRRALSLVATTVRSVPRSLQVLRPLACRRRLENAAAAVKARQAVETMSDEALLGELSLWSSPEAGALRKGMDMLTGALVALMGAERLFSDWPDARELLAAGIDGNPTTEISLRIDELVAAAHPIAEVFTLQTETEARLAALEESAEGRVWLEQLHDFLSFAGQRGPGEFDFASPRWADDPSMVLDLVEVGLSSPPRESVRQRLTRLASERERAIAAAIAGSPFWKRPAMRFFERAVALLMPLREAPKHYGLHVFYRVRRSALELGRRLAASGVLEDTNDVFLLSLDELADSIRRPASAPPGLAARLETRREEMKDFAERPAPDMVRSDGVPVVMVDTSGEPSADGAHQGTGVSRGAGVGPVRVLREPDPKAMREGDVLVVPFADPGWTPLFPRAAALVMEVGGTICHAAVVARELGIPAVFGFSNATTQLKDGQMVEVDGSTGTVRLLTAPPAD
jgi:pyruvate,water dikinase